MISSGVVQNAATRQATEPSTAAVGAPRPCEPTMSKSRRAVFVKRATSSAGGPTARCSSTVRPACANCFATGVKACSNAAVSACTTSAVVGSDSNPLACFGIKRMSSMTAWIKVNTARGPNRSRCSIA